MKKIWFLLLISVSLASCTSQAATQAPNVIPAITSTIANTATSVPPTDIPTLTSTPIPPTETATQIPSPTDTAIPPTETITPTDIVTLTLTPTPPASPPPPKQTTNLNVNVSSLSQFSFEVPANSDLTLSDMSTDGRANACIISKPGFSKSINIPTGFPSTKFQLPAGVYRLTCGIPNIGAKITSR